MSQAKDDQTCLRVLARRELLDAIRVAIARADDANEPARSEGAFDACENVASGLVEYLRAEEEGQFGGHPLTRANLLRFFRQTLQVDRAAGALAALAHNYAFGFEIARLYLLQELEIEEAEKRASQAAS